MRTLKRFFISLTGVVSLFAAESPARQASATFSWRIHHERLLFAFRAWPPDFRGSGLVSRDSTYPVWRAGADAATTLRTGADLDIGGLYVPAAHSAPLTAWRERPAQGRRTPLV